MFAITALIILLLFSCLEINAEDERCALKGEANKWVASGIRRKNLFVVELDVYKVDIFVNPHAFSEITSEQVLKLAEPSAIIGSQFALTLTFLRSVGTNAIVNAIVEALMGEGDAYKQALSQFKSMLLDAVGTGGVKTADEISFVYDNQDTVAIHVRGKAAGQVASAQLRNNLLDIYIGTKSLVPKLRAAFLEALQTASK